MERTRIHFKAVIIYIKVELVVEVDPLNDFEMVTYPINTLAEVFIFGKPVKLCTVIDCNNKFSYFNRSYQFYVRMMRLYPENGYLGYCNQYYYSVRISMLLSTQTFENGNHTLLPSRQPSTAILENSLGMKRKRLG